MSDRPSHKDILQLKLSIESPSLEYAHQSASRNVAFVADIPFPLLKGWYDFMNNLKSGVAKDQGKTFEGIKSYCDLLELAIPRNIFAISRNVEVRSEISESLTLVQREERGQTWRAKQRGSTCLRDKSCQ